MIMPPMGYLGHWTYLFNSMVCHGHVLLRIIVPMWVWPVWDEKKLNLIINFALDIRVGVSYRKVKLEMLLELILCRSLRKDVAG